MRHDVTIFDPQENQQASSEGSQLHSQLREFKLQASTRKVVVAVFLYIMESMLLDFKVRHNTAGANHYCQTLQKLHNMMKKKCQGNLTGDFIVIHNKSHPNVTHKFQD
jgi:hypothetical protein